MIDPVKVVKAVVLVLFMATLVGCGGGGGSSFSSGESAQASTLQTDSSQTNSVPDVFNGTGTVALSWLPPTTYTDNTTLANLAGYNIYLDNGSGYVKIQSITNPGVSDYLVENLSQGDYSFVITAFDADGAESSYSNVKSFSL